MRSHGAGCCKVHLAIHDVTRFAYLEVLLNDQKATVICVLSRAIAWFNSQGVECQRVISNSGPANVSMALAKTCRTLDLRHTEPGCTLPARTTRESGYSDPLPGMVLRHGLLEVRGARPLAAPLFGDL